MEFDPAQQIRLEIMNTIIAYVESRVAILRPALITGPEDGAIFSNETARREVWSLFRDGFSYLKEWAPGKGPGSITGALAKTNLRSTAIASSLNIARPEFAETNPQRKPLDPKGETFFLCDQLVKISLDDIPHSQQIIARAIAVADLNSAFNIPFKQEDLQKIFNAAGPLTDLMPEDILPARKTENMREQMRMHFNMLVRNYTDIGRELQRTLKTMPSLMKNRPNFGA